MFCEKCGNPMKESERFCARCGAPVNGTPPASGAGSAGGAPPVSGAGSAGGTPPVSEAGSAGGAPPASGAGRAGGMQAILAHKVFLISAAAVILLLILVLANFARLNNFLHKIFSSPAGYYRFVEKQEVRELADSAGVLYDTFVLDSLNMYDKSGSTEMTVNLTEDGMEFLELAGLAGVDLSWLRSVAVEGSFNLKDDILSMGAALRLNQNDIVSGSMIMDMDGESLYVQIPELTKTYLGISVEEVFGSYERRQLEAFRERQAAGRKMLEALPSKSSVEKLIDKYAKLALSCVQDVTMGSRTLKVEGVEQKCTELKIRIDAETLQNMRRTVLEEMLDDRDVEKLVKSMVVMGGMDGDYAYDEFVQSVEDSLEYPDYVDEDMELTMKVYVDGKGAVRGRIIEWEDYYDEVNFSVLMPESGGKFGYELSAESDGESVKLIGSGRKSGHKVTGDFEVKYNGASLVEIGVEKLNTKSLKKGELEGSFELSISSVTGMSMSVLRDMMLTVEADTGADSGKVGLGLWYDGEELGTLSVAFKKGKGSKVSIPGGKNVVMAESSGDLMDWIETIDWDKVITALEKADLPSDIMDTAEDIRDQLEEGNFMGLYRYLY